MAKSNTFMISLTLTSAVTQQEVRLRPCLNFLEYNAAVIWTPLWQLGSSKFLVYLFFLKVNNSSNLVSFYYRTEPSSSGGNNHDRLSDLKIIDQMLKTYDRRATPTNKIGQPTRVECELFIRSFGSISEKTMVRIKNTISFYVG